VFSGGLEEHRPNVPDISRRFWQPKPPLRGDSRLDHLPQNATGSSGMSSPILRDKRVIPTERDREEIVGNDAANGDIGGGPDGSASMSINTHLTQRQSNEPSIDGTHRPQSALSICIPASLSHSYIRKTRDRFSIDCEPLTERCSQSRFRSDRDQDSFPSTPSPALRLPARAIPPDSTAISEEISQSFFSSLSRYPPSTWHSPTPFQRPTPSQPEGSLPDRISPNIPVAVGSPSVGQHAESQKEQHPSVLARTVHPDRAGTFRTNSNPAHSHSTSCSSTPTHIRSGVHNVQRQPDRFSMFSDGLEEHRPNVTRTIRRYRPPKFCIDCEPLTERYSQNRFRSERDQDSFHSTPSPVDTGISHEPVPEQYRPNWDKGRIHLLPPARVIPLARAVPPDYTAIFEENPQSFFSGPSGHPPSTRRSLTPVQRPTPSQPAAERSLLNRISLGNPAVASSSSMSSRPLLDRIQIRPSKRDREEIAGNDAAGGDGELNEGSLDDSALKRPKRRMRRRMKAKQKKSEA
jgi:hypothetical protein